VKAGAAKFVSVQNHYSMIQREAEAEVLPEGQKSKLAFLGLETASLGRRQRAGANALGDAFLLMDLLPGRSGGQRRSRHGHS
jgi:aryl-alcohol dehydrogenase-like predicted oxidoreductase